MCHMCQRVTDAGLPAMGARLLPNGQWLIQLEVEPPSPATIIKRLQRVNLEPVDYGWDREWGWLLTVREANHDRRR